MIQPTVHIFVSNSVIFINPVDLITFCSTDRFLIGTFIHTLLSFCDIK